MNVIELKYEVNLLLQKLFVRLIFHGECSHLSRSIASIFSPL